MIKFITNRWINLTFQLSYVRSKATDFNDGTEHHLEWHLLSLILFLSNALLSSPCVILTPFAKSFNS